MNKSRFQFTIKGLLLAVALLAGPMFCLRQLTYGDIETIDIFGPVQFRQDRSIEVQGGSIRVNRGNRQTEIQANRIVVQKDGTIEVYDRGTIVQTTR
jgi:hypothetical protein